MATYEEWRVSGDWGEGPTEYTWSPTKGSSNPEGSARKFAADMAEYWHTDGPHLHKRTVTVTEWEDAGPPPLNRPHPTCIDVTAIDQTTPRSEWICGPECPKEA